MMKFRNLLLASLICLLFGTCKKDKEAEEVPVTETPQYAFQSYQMMESTAQRFIEIGDSMNITPPEALYLTSQWAENQPGVEYAYTLDSAILIIHMTSGFESMINLREIGLDGLNKYRGGSKGTGKLVANINSSVSSSSNRIQNKKILLFCAEEEQFYPGNEYQTRVVDVIQNGDIRDLDITVLKNQDCNIDAILSLDQYGLVILDTHGTPNGVFTGVKFYLDSVDIPGTADAFLSLIGQKIGAQYIDALKDGRIVISYEFEYNPQLQVQAEWDKYKQRLNTNYQVKLTSKGIRQMMPDLSNTIVFANCCYSAWTAEEFQRTTSTRIFKNPDPVKVAWMSRNPLAFYGYESAMDGVSYKAPNAEFCKPNEDTLIHGFFYDSDSTGNANLANISGIETVVEFPWNDDIGSSNNHGPLRFNQYADPTWSYGNCGDTITDSRDGQQYPTVCIGSQVWFAKNLNYSGAGIYYDNDAGNGIKYGKLYTIAELTNLDTSSANPSGVRGLCPQGWHVPSTAEWKQLFDFAGGVNASKLCDPADWPQPNQNTNELGMSLMPGGQFVTGSSGSTFLNLDDYGYYWSSTRSPDGQWFKGVLVHRSSTQSVVGYNDDNDIQYEDFTNYGVYSVSCRCVKD